MKRIIVCCLAVILLFCSAACAADPKGSKATESFQTEAQSKDDALPADTADAKENETQRKDNLLPAWTGAFSEENLKAAIARYQSDYAPFTPDETGKALSVSFETDFEVVQCTVSRLSKVDDRDMDVELNGYIDSITNVEISGKTVTVDTGFWYDGSSWVNEWPVWSYLVCAKDAADTAHYYYFRVAYSNAPILQTAEDFAAYFESNPWYIRAMGCIFETPEDISPWFYFYSGVGENGQYTKEEEKFLKDKYKEKNPDGNQDIALDALKLPVAEINEALSILGVTAENIQIPDRWVYNEQTNAYYFWVSDAYGVTGWSVAKVVKGVYGRVAVYWETDDYYWTDASMEERTAEGAKMVMTLQRQADGTYHILANVPQK